MKFRVRVWIYLITCLILNILQNRVVSRDDCEDQDHTSGFKPFVCFFDCRYKRACHILCKYATALITCQMQVRLNVFPFISSKDVSSLKYHTDIAWPKQLLLVVPSTSSSCTRMGNPG